MTCDVQNGYFGTPDVLRYVEQDERETPCRQEPCFACSIDEPTVSLTGCCSNCKFFTFVSQVIQYDLSTFVSQVQLYKIASANMQVFCICIVKSRICMFITFFHVHHILHVHLKYDEYEFRLTKTLESFKSHEIQFQIISWNTMMTV